MLYYTGFFSPTFFILLFQVRALARKCGEVRSSLAIFLQTFCLCLEVLLYLFLHFHWLKWRPPLSPLCVVEGRKVCPHRDSSLVLALLSLLHVLQVRSRATAADAG